MGTNNQLDQAEPSELVKGEIGRKMRTLVAMAYHKMWTNRFKDVDGDGNIKEGKWEKVSHNAWTGERLWVTTLTSFLHGKLDEEVGELKQAVVENHSTADILFEGGDVVAMTTFVADQAGAFNANTVLQPKVVCLCGSTKFKPQWEEANLSLTLSGHIVLSVGGFVHADGVVITPEQKIALDLLHFRKIDLADEIFVVNVGGYIGESCRNEINYAIRTGKFVKYMYEGFETR